MQRLGDFGPEPARLALDPTWAYVRLGFKRDPYPWKYIMLPGPLLSALCPTGWPIQLSSALAYTIQAYSPKAATSLHRILATRASPLDAVPDIYAAVALPQQLQTDFTLTHQEDRAAAQTPPLRGAPVPGLDGLVMTLMTTSRTRPSDT